MRAYRVTSASDIAELTTDLYRAIDDGPVKVAVTTSRQASRPARDLFHVWCREIARAMVPGANADDEALIKNELMRQYGQMRVRHSPVAGHAVAYRKSIMRYDQSELSELMDLTRAWAAQNGIELIVEGEYEQWMNEAR